MHKLFFSLLWALLCSIHASADALIDQGWTFHLGDTPEASQPDFDDSGWRRLDLPHDWSVEQSPAKANPMGNAGGYYAAGIGWYRRVLAIHAKKGRHYALHFEGVYQKATVYCNGHQASYHAYGFTPFRVDLTPWLNASGRNVIAVRVDNSAQINCRWYTGSGIYRHVHLEERGDVALAPDGIFITTPQVNAETATVNIEVGVMGNADGRIEAEVWPVGRKSHTLKTSAAATAGRLTLNVPKPALWSPDAPNLYRARVTLTNKSGQVLDCRTLRFGIRKIEYSADKGLLVNGRPTIINGGCLHHDCGPLGAASFDRAEQRKAELIKQAGFNAVRLSHNPHSTAFIDACDSLGLLVVSEAFDGWRDAKNPHDYSTLFDDNWRSDISALVLRDRNHPSVFLWSTGNEVIERKKIEVVTTAARLRDQVRSFDPTRPVISALAKWDSDWEIYDPLADVHDMVGYNYILSDCLNDHQRRPQRVMIQTETYPDDLFENYQASVGQPYILGEFVWTALDYLGEAGIGRAWLRPGEDKPYEHFQQDIWPWHGAYCGDIDLTGLRKPVSYYRQLLYCGYASEGRDTSLIHLTVREPQDYTAHIAQTQWSTWPTFDCWTWPGHEGKPITVEVYSRCAAVRLLLNGKEIGTQNTDTTTACKATFTLPYTPGTLTAIGLNAEGHPQCRQILATAGKPARLLLTADRHSLTADGQDLCFVTAQLVDNEGRLCPFSDREINFTVSGAATLSATATADMTDTIAATAATRPTWRGRAQAIIRTTHKAGTITLKAKAGTLKAAIKLKSMD